MEHQLSVDLPQGVQWKECFVRSRQRCI